MWVEQLYLETCFQGNFSFPGRQPWDMKFYVTLGTNVKFEDFFFPLLFIASTFCSKFIRFKPVWKNLFSLWSSVSLWISLRKGPTQAAFQRSISCTATQIKSVLSKQILAYHAKCDLKEQGLRCNWASCMTSDKSIKCNLFVKSVQW